MCGVLYRKFQCMSNSVQLIMVDGLLPFGGAGASLIVMLCPVRGKLLTNGYADAK